MKEELYEIDFVLWAKTQAEHLLNQDWQEIDWQNISEEVAALGRSEKRELKNRLEVLLEHLLKRCYISTTDDHRGWELTIKEQRKQLGQVLQDSPSLRQYWARVFPEVWQEARSDVQDLYPTLSLPEICPFPHNFSEDPEDPEDIDRLLSEPFWQTDLTQSGD